MTPNNEQILAAVAEQAGTWFLENRRGPLNSEARSSFMAWLRASPVHVQEYLGVAALAGDLAAAVSEPQVSSESLVAEARADVDNVVSLDPPLPTRAPARPRLRVSRAWSLASAATVAIIIVASAAIWSGRDGERFGLPKTYSTAHGDQSVRQLPDGSVLRLNTDSTVTVRYSRAERIADLDRGEAFFHVAPDSKRRFRVAAGEAGVIAVGTKFNLYRRIGAVTVTAVEGTVAVFTGTPPPPTPTNLLLSTALRVSAGFQVEVRSRVGPPRPVDASAAVAWLDRKIAFKNRPLGEVADEFNRYGHILIEIEDQDLRAMPISGAFDAYDTDSFAAFLETLEGVIVQRTPTRFRVLRLNSAKRERLPIAQ